MAEGSDAYGLRTGQSRASARMVSTTSTRAARRLLTVFVVALLASTLSGTGTALEAERAAPPSGDRRGLALLALVQKAYLAVPGVAAQIKSLKLNSELVLRSGVVVAQQTTGRGPGGETTFVARRGASTYVREPGKSCWRVSAGVSLDDLGVRFPGAYRLTVQAPRRVSGGWTLRAPTESKRGARATVTYMIDSTSHLLRSLVVQTSPGNQVVERVHELTTAPRILTPRPRC